MQKRTDTHTQTHKRTQTHADAHRPTAIIGRKMFCALANHSTAGQDSRKYGHLIGLCFFYGDDNAFYIRPGLKPTVRIRVHRRPAKSKASNIFTWGIETGFQNCTTWVSFMFTALWKKINRYIRNIWRILCNYIFETWIIYLVFKNRLFMIGKKKCWIRHQGIAAQLLPWANDVQVISKQLYLPLINQS